jgi:hypothetical protein
MTMHVSQHWRNWVFAIDYYRDRFMHERERGVGGGGGGTFIYMYYVCVCVSYVKIWDFTSFC